ncbi:hypothetical protein [uncultured Prevotella sp.]|uniref:hypothetical protein n=1 Tax=uncultured Prevotella sp. TaxID=159272 RepID=UPI0027E2CF66|nr:hypothetical protein [uncultured Prevotella sp.]
MSSNNTTASNASAWTEVEYSARCMSPYISTPIYIPEETSYYLCREGGVREQHKLTFVVFRAEGADPDDWEDSPMMGRLDICVLGEGDEEVEPVEAVYLGVPTEQFINVVREDDNEIVFDFTWRYGSISIDRATKTDEGWVIKKDDFGEDGIAMHLTPRKGNAFILRLVMPYVGFSLTDDKGNRVSGDIEIKHEDVSNYNYRFVGNPSNDRFQISLDDNKLNYMCVLTEDNRLSVRDMRERLALVDEIETEGTLDQLLMGAHSILVKNKSSRWRIQLTGEDVDGASDVEINGVALARFAFERYTEDKEVDEDLLAQRLMHMEQRYAFQWYWLCDDDWSHENLEGLMDMEGLDADPEKMMRQALLFNRYETFMKRLAAFSYISQRTIQGDQLQARNNKRKIARCVRHLLAHRAGEENVWELDEEARKEIQHFHGTFHREFVAALEE